MAQTATRKWDLGPRTPTDCSFCFGVGNLKPVPGAAGNVPCPFECHPDREPDLLLHGGLHEQVLARNDKWVAWVDAGILDDVLLLWSHNIPTWVSCEGEEELMGRYVGLVGYDYDQDLLRELLPWVKEIDNPDAARVGLALYAQEAWLYE